MTTRARAVAAPQTQDDLGVETIRRVHAEHREALVTSLRPDPVEPGPTPQDVGAAVDHAFVQALRRPVAFRYHHDPVDWLRSVAHRDLGRARPQARPASMDLHASAYPTSTFDALLGRARRLERRRHLMALAVALTLLVAIVVYEVTFGPALQVISPTFSRVLGHSVWGA